MKPSTSNSQSAYEVLRDAIRSAREERQVEVSAILLHPRWVVRGYAYLIEQFGKHFILMNTSDMIMAVATMDTRDIVDALNVPIVEDEKEAARVLNGVYQCVYRL